MLPDFPGGPVDGNQLSMHEDRGFDPQSRQHFTCHRATPVQAPQLPESTLQSP